MPPVVEMRNWIPWLPPLAFMAVIFRLSAIPGPDLPFFGEWDFIIKKAGHAIGFGLLGVSYYHALPPRLPRAARWSLAWIMALGFAVSDELHQTFVVGRTASLRDIGIDAFGATLFLIWGSGYPSRPSS